MIKLLIIFISYSNLTFSQQIKEETLHFQNELNTFYLNPKTTPLSNEELKDFKGLSFYPYNENMIVNATLERLKDQTAFQMPTTGSKQPMYKRYGILYFEISGKKMQLEVYQNLELMNKPGFEKHLFLPFLDNTNGVETYGGGRYLDIEIPEGNKIVLNFNKAYNPYCTYTLGYSCPITPEVNFLETSIKAGVRL